MNEIQRIEMIKVAKALLDEGFFTKEEFAYLKKSIICDSPKSYEATFGDVQKAKELLGKKGLTQDEFDAIKTDFLLGKPVVNVELLSSYADLYNKGLIKSDELGYLKAGAFSNRTAFSGTQVLEALKSAFNKKTISEDEYNALRIATIYGEKTPSASAINNLSGYYDLLKAEIVTEHDYETIKKVVLADGTIGSPESFKGLTEYKKLLEDGAINQEEYDAKKKAVMPTQTASHFIFPEHKEVKEGSTVPGSKEDRYENAVTKIETGSSKKIEEAIEELELLGDWEDSKELIKKAKDELPTIIAAEEKKKEEERSKKRKKIIVIAAAAFVCVIGVTILVNVIHSKQLENSYNSAITLYENGEYEQAKDIFDGLSGYKQSTSWSVKCENEIKEQERLERLYESAMEDYNDKAYEEALDSFIELGDYKDSAEMAKKTQTYIDTIAAREKELEELEKEGDFEGLEKAIEKYKDTLDEDEYEDYKATINRCGPWVGDYTFDDTHDESDSRTLANMKKSVKKFSLEIKDDGLHIDYDGGSFVAERTLSKEGREDCETFYFVHNEDDATVSVERWNDGSLEVEYVDFSGKEAVTYWGYYNQDKK